jgi:hypothetical protein
MKISGATFPTHAFDLVISFADALVFGKVVFDVSADRTMHDRSLRRVIVCRQEISEIGF